MSRRPLIPAACLCLSLIGPSCEAAAAKDLFLQMRDKPESRQCLTIDSPFDTTTLVENETNPTLRTLVMTQQNIAEGWSWRPGSKPDEEDYYQYKYLVVGSEVENRGEYQAEDQIGERQTMRIVWRYDYFLAFDNVYDFFPRTQEDDDGFQFHALTGAPNQVTLRATLCLTPPSTSESTTFWKATHGQPVDFTLKKRYLLGTLKQLDIIDPQSGRVLETLQPTHHP